MYGDRQRARGDFRKLSKRNSLLFLTLLILHKARKLQLYGASNHSHFLFHTARDLSWFSYYEHPLKTALKSTGEPREIRPKVQRHLAYNLALWLIANVGKDWNSRLKCRERLEFSPRRTRIQFRKDWNNIQ